MSGRERPLQSWIFNCLYVKRGPRRWLIRTHNAEVVGSSPNLATNYTRSFPSTSTIDVMSLDA
jgi:hypothetical protein